MARVNQCSLVLNQLMRAGRITAKEARDLGIKSLSSRVKELRQLGVPVTTSDDGGYCLPYWLQKARGKKRGAESPTEETKLF